MRGDREGRHTTHRDRGNVGAETGTERQERDVASDRTDGRSWADHPAPLGLDESHRDRTKRASAAIHGGPPRQEPPLDPGEPRPQLHGHKGGTAKGARGGAAVGPEQVGRKKP